MIFKRITMSLLCLFPMLAVMVLMGVLHTPSTNAAPNGIQTVTTLADSGAGSLRQAIIDATAGDTIEFSVSGTIVLASELTIDKDLTINGGGGITVSGNTVTRIFKVTNGNVTFDSVTIANGRTQSLDCTLDGFFYTPCGAGILIQDSAVAVIITNSIITNNGTILGGAVFNDSELTIVNSTFSENSGVAYLGGGIFNRGKSTISDTVFLGNSAIDEGGAISNHGQLTIMNSTVSENLAQGSEGGGGLGGGIYTNRPMTISKSIISGNSGNSSGGGIFSSASIITIDQSTISGNSARQGGGIYTSRSITISKSTISGNSSSSGGGIYIYMYTGVMIIDQSTISGNSALNGGGIYMENSDWCHLVCVTTINQSTISGNSALARGGGIYRYIQYSGSIDRPSTIIQSSTIFDNAAVNGGSGMFVAIYWDFPVFLKLDLSNSMRVANFLIDAGSGFGTVTNTIISGNNISGTMTADDFKGEYRLGPPSPSEAVLPFASGGNNLVGATGTNITTFVDGVNGDQVGVNAPKLDPLADNGGPTLTHALQSDSPALDMGANCGATDQRGVARPLGAACDIGAYEALIMKFVFLPAVMK